MDCIRSGSPPKSGCFSALITVHGNRCDLKGICERTFLLRGIKSRMESKSIYTRETYLLIAEITTYIKIKF